LVNVSVLLSDLGTTTTLSGPTSSTYGQSLTYTATVTSNGSPVASGTVTFLDGSTPLSAALPVDGNGQVIFSIATLNAGSHKITAAYSSPLTAGTTPLGPSAASSNLGISPAPLVATAVNFSATAGAPFSGTVATFVNADPFGSASSYTALIDWGDGSISIGTISGSGVFTVTGAHTYGSAGADTVTVQITHNLGDTTPATAFTTASVVDLGQFVPPGLPGTIGFWHSPDGQALIDTFNGDPTSTALSTWLAATLPNLYGPGLAGYDLTGLTNAQVAAFYQSQFALPGPKVEAQVLAAALNVYATTLSLGGTAAQAYGFPVSAAGLGAYSFIVGKHGAAFGVADDTTLNVYELLEAVNGLAYADFGDPTLRKEVHDVFAALN
jgi:hypothetical protein